MGTGPTSSPAATSIPDPMRFFSILKTHNCVREFSSIIMSEKILKLSTLNLQLLKRLDSILQYYTKSPGASYNCVLKKEVLLFTVIDRVGHLTVSSL
jgi:hypothetical protein